MSKRFLQTRPLLVSCLCSVLVHVALAQAVGVFGRYVFAPAVGQPPAVTVELSDPAATPAPDGAGTAASSPAPAAIADAQAETAVATAPAPGSIPLTPASATDETAGSDIDSGTEPSPADLAAQESGSPASAPATPASDTPQATAKPPELPAAKPHQAAAPPVPRTMLKSVSDFLAPRYEKLSYQITMHGLPIGNAELESKSEQGITSIILRVRSNAAFSGIYPVEDLVETRHIDGLYIMTRISQREGSFSSEENFTINLRKKRVSWFDLKRPRSLAMDVPTENVLDSLSGIYYLRNRQLQVGKNETLYIYDSETYAEVPVEILRREEMSLANFRKVNTLVVRPLQKTAGIFRRTGDLLIWMTDDAARVPVKIETSIALGKVVARLISAESQPYPAATTAKAETPSSPCPPPPPWLRRASSP